MKTKFYAWATLFCLTGTLAAADAVSDWTGRDSKPSNLTSGTDCLSIDGKELYIFSTQSFPVKADGKYVLSGTFRRIRGNSSPSPLFFGLALYDNHGKWMNGLQSCPMENTRTTLSTPVKKGDRIIRVRDASAWVKRASVMAFDAKPDFSDLPNRSTSPTITHIEKKGEEWEVSLRHPINREYAAGTAVRQQSGPPYLYVRTGYPLTEEWKTLVSPVIQGIGTRRGQFWQGTATVKIVIFSTIGKPAGIEMKNIEFKEIK